MPGFIRRYGGSSSVIMHPGSPFVTAMREHVRPAPHSAAVPDALRNMTTTAVRAAVVGVTFLGSHEYRRQALTGRSATLPRGGVPQVNTRHIDHFELQA
jgi:hypothetical protein